MPNSLSNYVLQIRTRKQRLKANHKTTITKKNKLTNLFAVKNIFSS